MGYSQTLIEQGANVLFSVRSEKRKQELHVDAEIFICDYEIKEDIESLAKKVFKNDKLHGILHSIAFANYSDGILPFHETKRRTFCGHAISSFP